MKTKIVIIGGFLGAGKTTLATKVVAKFREMGKTAALITNDQGETLVDTQYTKSMDIAVEEVLRGCFCCRFPDFLRSARILAMKSRPDVILAEPVGSCTDLLSTVIVPLKTLYPNEFDIAPLLVVVDSPRLLSHRMKSEDLGDYLKKCQIEEGEIIILSKTDMVSKEDIPELVRIIRGINPNAEIIQYSAVDNKGLDLIMSIMTSQSTSQKRPIEVDYDKYAAAEAELGWYNGSLEFELGCHSDLYGLAIDILKSIAVNYKAGEIAHVKLMIMSGSNALKVSLVDQQVSVDGIKGGRYGEGKTLMTVNARVISSPEKLKRVVRESIHGALLRVGAEIKSIEDSSFAPSRPQPTHKMMH
ncbi:MAG: GTP-binding protein [Methanomassiliicoccales archaeon]|jgi:G3E family GTPase|nr:GTP-binding protein [Methanomassiliicoccales archaeon]